MVGSLHAAQDPDRTRSRRLLLGWMVTSLGYRLLFVVLIAFANLQAGVAWRQVVRRHHLKPSAA